MTMRAHLNLAGFTIEKHPQGLHYVIIKVDGADVQQHLGVNGGRFYIDVDGIDPHLPPEFTGKVTSATSRDRIIAGCEQSKLVRPGVYTAPRGSSRAEVREEMMCGKFDLAVDIRADTIDDLLWFRRLVLSGNARRELSYTLDAAV